ncbi:hypothetical protein MW887_005068, partial [Aspergillus wentii]
MPQFNEAKIHHQFGKQCLFPTIDSGTGNPNPSIEKLHSVTVELEAGLDLYDFCEENGISLSRLLQGASGLLEEPGLDGRHEFNTVMVQRPFSRTGSLGNIETDVFFGNAQIFVVIEIEETVSISIDCMASALSEKQAEKVAGTLGQALCNIVHNPHKTLREVDLCSPYDMAQLKEWNKWSPMEHDSCVHDVIYEQCIKQPEALAVSSWDGDLTYQELDRLSSRLAVHLNTLGVGPERFVPLCFEKSKWAIVAMLGVIRAGGAYVFLDPSYPLPRMRSICDDLEANLILASAMHYSTAEKLERDVFRVADAEIARNANENQDYSPSATPHNALYVAFSSGSTGRPKGVVMEHRAFYAKAMAIGPVLSLNHKSRVLQFANFAFDVSNRDILFTLMFGGRICMPSEFDRYNNIGAFMNLQKVNWASLTPSTVNMIDPNSVPDLQHLVLAGEPMTPFHVASWAKKVNLMNAYGPCECATISSLQTAISQTADHMNIGRGIGCVLWVVDTEDHNQLAPIGAIGELVIESVSVGRGYISNPTETNKSFLQKPTAWLHQFRNGTSGRLYKTGDLVRYNPDGTLVFIGRKDAQVKIRGQRVELGEVEHNLQQGLVNGASVTCVAEMVTPQGSSNPILIAFLGIGEEAIQSPDDTRAALGYLTEGLEDRLAEQLPRYMVPSAYIPIGQIPMTATGKTDRRRLREIGGSLTLEQLAELQPARGERQTPGTKIEWRLQRLWASVLGINRHSIGREDSFLQIGGDSIGAMRLVAAAREEGLSFTVADIFEYPRLCHLAERVKTVEHQENTVAPFTLLKAGVDQDVLAQAVTQCGIHSDQIEDIFPCTPLQEGLLAMTAKRPGKYIGRRVLELQDDIDITQFKQAWEEVILTTAILRTRIVDLQEQGLVQVVITDRIEWKASQDLCAYLANDQQQPMGLGTALARFAMVEDRGRGKHYFVLTMHHAVYDGWSMPLILDQVKQSYWQEQHDALTPFQGFVGHIMNINEEMDQYWQDQLAGSEAVPSPSLPSPGYEPQADQTLQYQVAALDWPQNDITASTAVRAAWAILAAHYTNSSDVIIGATVTGRQASIPGIERIAGPTIATVPVRVNVDWERNVDTLLQQVQAQAIKMTEFEQIGLQRIRRISQDIEQQSQFQTLLVVQPASQADTARRSGELFQATLDGRDSEDAGGLEAFNTYAMMVVCQLEPHGVQMRVSFDSQVIKQEQVKQMAHQLEHVLQQICKTEMGQQSVKDVQMASKQDICDIWEWNATVPVTVELCVHDLIAERTRQQPDAPAICAWDGELTYAELDDLSTRLAHQLVKVGVSPDMIVPLCFEKSMWMPVAMLGVMKAGAASVAMDTTQPEERLQSIVQQVCPKVIVCSAKNEDLAGRLGVSAVITADKANLAQSDGPLNTHLPAVEPSSNLYVVFTSGSTGTPKGAVISHRNFSSAIEHQQSSLQFTKDSRVFDFVSYAFDVSWSNVLHTLTAGGCLCIPHDDDRRGNIIESMNKLRVNYAHLTPTVARLLDPSDISGLHVLVLSGEPMSKADVAQWRPYVNLLNTYGPAECSVTSTAQRMDKTEQLEICIGEGMGCNTWVVDTMGSDQLLPLGCTGELLVEGPIVGVGYLGDPEKTAASFVDNPPWLLQGGPGHPGRQGRLYRTGDLVRYNSDGRLVFVGRKDAQVKIRGQRVELGDVEHHVRQNLMEGIDTPVVAEVIKPRGSDNPILVLYLAIGKEANASLETVRAAVRKLTQGLDNRLAEQLPGYMVPNAYIPVDKIPIMATGKMDRRRLRAMGESLTLENLAALQPSRHKKQRKPTTQMERQLQDLWASILRVDANSIGADDNFLRIGGDSVAAMRLVSAARERGLLLSVAAIFSKPRLCDLALLVEVDGHLSDDMIAPFSLLKPQITEGTARLEAARQCDVEEHEVEDVFPCTPLQEGLLAMTVKRPGDYIGRTVLELQPHVDISHFQKAWEDVVSRTRILQTRIINLPGQGLVQAVINEQVQWTEREDFDTYVNDDEHIAMGLGTALARFGLVKGNHPHVLFVLTLHHALYDGWSIPLMLEQAVKAYKGDSGSIPVPFQGFIKHITEFNEGASQYWQAQLEGSEAASFPALPSLGYGYQSRADQVLHHHIQAVQWPQNGITASTVVRTAWAILLAQYTTVSDVVFGAIVSGRQAPVPGVERMAGPTIATVPVRVKMDWEASINALLQQVQTQATEMNAFEQTGLQQIRRISPETARGSEFQNLLVIQPSSHQDKASEENGVFIRSSNYGDGIKGLNAFTTTALLLECQLETNGVSVNISFDSNVIERQEVQRIIQQLEHVLWRICEGSEHLQIKDVNTISKEDITDIWNWNAQVFAPIEACVHDLIAEKAQQQPDAPAICAWDGNLKYRELDVLSTRLAHHLVGLGVGAGSDLIVPLCFEKSMWMPVAMLGVMKAGGASVAMDMTQPEQRLRAIVQQVQPAIILSSRKNQDLAKRLHAGTMVLVDADLEQLYGLPDSPLPVIDPSSKLYIVFTSGSTGTPKGAIITHSNFSSAVTHQKDAFGFTATARVFDFASYSFDASWFNFLHSATSGACLCIPEESARKDDLAAAMEQMGVNFVQLTPSTARAIDPDTVPSLQTLVLAGEPVTSKDLAIWGSRVDVRNAYGPAECTVAATATVIRDHQVSNIGRGRGLNTWVVDQSDNGGLVPIGAVGELWLEGPLVGQGYLGDLQKTAASFVQDPAWLLHGSPSHPGRCGRLYRTGDLVRYDTDGTLVFMGRKDSQVKIRGQRVELGEVEHYIRQSFCGVQDVVADVVISTKEKRPPTLMAFVWCKQSGERNDYADADHDSIFTAPDQKFWSAVQAGETQLRDVLPSYMVPAVFIPVHHIPMTAAGKANRRLLREQAAVLSRQQLEAYTHPVSAKRKPSTEAEKTMQQLWSQVLNIEPAHIRADDSFFWLGGDSISAMQLSAKCRSRGFPITVSQIFQHKSLARLARFAGETDNIVMDTEEQFDVSFGLSPIQQMFFENEPNGHNHFNQSFLLRVAREVASEDVVHAVDSIISQHSMLRARFRQAADGSWTQFLTSSKDGCYRYRQYQASSLEEATHGMAASQMSLNIQTGPLFAVDLINTCEGQYLFLVAHHLVIDLVSWRIILDDLEELLTTGISSNVHSLAFQPWCQLQHDYARNHLDPERALPFDVPPMPDLYWGSAVEQNTYADIHCSDFMLSKETTELLFGPANDAFQTQPVEIFQAALIHSFMKTFHDRPAPTIFNEGHGREPWDDSIDLSRTVGWFTTLWPTHVTVESSHDMVESVRRTKDARRSVPSNGWAYFASRYLNPKAKKSFSSHGPVEVLFNYLGLYQQLDRRDAFFNHVGNFDGRPSDMAEDLKRSSLMEVTASAKNGCLQFTFSYNRYMKHQDLISSWIANCERCLEEAAKQLVHLQQSWTLSDLPLLPLTYDSLEIFMSQSLPQIGTSQTEVEDAYPCTPMQQLMLQSQAEMTGLYAPSLTGQIRAAKGSQPINIEKLKTSWQKLVNRHASLRTIFLHGVTHDGWDQV